MPKTHDRQVIARAALRHIANNTKIDPTNAIVQKTILALSAGGYLKRPAGTVPQKESTRIDPTGSMRRLQCLAAEGWSMPTLSELIGIGREALWKICSGKSTYIAKDTEQAIRDVFESPEYDNASRFAIEQSVTLTKRYARRKGYLTREHWSGHDIDDPGVQP